ncbi:MAG: protein-glutamate O-methyltransferase CheR [Candidatus Methanosuratus sp.]|nr:protein-glutamate O-methyltransferase CheR [Candidatus Methanosuratincola sp.]
MEISENEFRMIMKALSTMGIKIESYKLDFLRRRILARMMATRSKTAMDYIYLLRKNPEEQKAFLDSISINVSEFFRDPLVWDGVKLAFKERIGEKIVSGLEPTLRIWSVGCSCGEEPYTIAIVALEVFKELGIPQPKLSVQATDIDRDALRKGNNGIFSESAIKNIPRGLKTRYLLECDCLGASSLTDRSGTMYYSVSDEVKKVVRFRYHDLVVDPPMLFMDAVFCRNLLIYLSQETQKIIIGKLQTSLTKGGFLVLGMNEVIMFEGTSFEAYDSRNRIYRKKSL